MLEIFKGKKLQVVDIDSAQYSNFTAYHTCGAIVPAVFGPHFWRKHYNRNILHQDYPRVGLPIQNNSE